MWTRTSVAAVPTAPIPQLGRTRTGRRRATTCHLDRTQL